MQLWIFWSYLKFQRIIVIFEFMAKFDKYISINLFVHQQSFREGYKVEK